MNELAQTQRQSLRATIATALAVGLIGLLTVLLMSDAGAAQTPGGDEEAESADINLTRCHGEGLMDTQIQDILVGPNTSVAEYCGSVASFEGDQDESEPESGTTYPTGCQGEGLPMDPAAKYQGPGSIAEYCTPDNGSDGVEDDPGNNRPLERLER